MITNKTQQLYLQKTVSQPQPPVTTKYATLSPYLVEIEKRKKARQLSREHRAKSKNQNSSKSFRIKERSTTSLRSQTKRELNNKTIINIISKKIQASKNGEVMGGGKKQKGYEKYKYYSKERDRSRQFQRQNKQKIGTTPQPNTCTIKLKPNNRTISRALQPQQKSISTHDPQKRTKKQISFRKNKYQYDHKAPKENDKQKNRQTSTMILNQMTLSQQENNTNMKTIEVSKYGYTDTNRGRRDGEPYLHVRRKDKEREKEKEKEKEYLGVGVGQTADNVYAIGKKKFRRGKYQALYSSVNSNQIDLTPSQPPIKSQSRLQNHLSKKQSNLSINKQFHLDLLQSQKQREHEKYHHQLRSREIHKSLQKSTEKYFKQDSTYRVPKTNNDIEIYVSTVKNPAFKGTGGNRDSNASTLYSLGRNQGGDGASHSRNTDQDKEKDRNREKERDSTSRMGLNYDFQFRDNQHSVTIAGIAEIENPSQQDSVSNNFVEETSFQKQRKAVQKQYFHKKSPQVDWSDDDCQIGDI